jgi:hypothetical protein
MSRDAHFLPAKHVSHVIAAHKNRLEGSRSSFWKEIEVSILDKLVIRRQGDPKDLHVRDQLLEKMLCDWWCGGPRIA